MDELLTTYQIIDKIKHTYFKRAIKQLHIHHTWKPNHQSWESKPDGFYWNIVMRRYHKSIGYQDIAQHLTLLPDGMWVTGRDFNIDPASIKGWNTGAFCIEMLGNFDKNNDVLKGKQENAIYAFCNWFCRYTGLDIDTDIKFHRDSPTAGKTCPGTGINKSWFLKQVKEARTMYDDYKDISKWAIESVDKLKEFGIMVGDDKNCFNPKKDVTREELAVALHKIIKFMGG
jgi:hypothetical protein